MVHSATTLSVIITALVATAPALTSARLPGGNQLGSRHAHAAPHKKAAAAVVEAGRSLVPDFDKIRRAGNDMMARSVGDSQKKKRKVKKRKNTCVQQTGFSASSATSTLTASATQASSPASETASSSVIGQEALVSTASSTASKTAISSASAASASASSTTNYNSPWNLEETWAGSSFFDNWSFWNYADPTHGTVNYVDASTAWNDGLVSINSAGNAIMKVDTTQTVTNARKSVRLHGNLVFTGGMVLMDAVHMPTGCGTWPAWWQNGPNWPIGGEIDILEGVNDFAINQVSLHTDNGCTMGTMTMTGTLTTGSFDSKNCASYATSNQGCGVRTSDTTSYGAGFNTAGGGVYAMVWDKAGINVYWFPRSSIPADITADQPVPSTWGEPMANFPSASCDPYKYFYDNFNIFDTTLCGDWAGGVWNYADSGAGQSQSCASSTGYSSCAAYVLAEGSKFTEAYWEIKSVKYFNSTTEL